VDDFRSLAPDGWHFGRMDKTATERRLTGIAYVLVNGIIVIDHEHHTGTLPGKALKGSGYTQKSKRNT